MIKNTLVLSVDEAKEALVKHYTDFLISNPVHLADMLRQGTFNTEVPNLRNAKPDALGVMLRDNGVGADLATANNVDMVVLHTGVLEMQVIYCKH